MFSSPPSLWSQTILCQNIFLSLSSSVIISGSSFRLSKLVSPVGGTGSHTGREEVGGEGSENLIEKKYDAIEIVSDSYLAKLVQYSIMMSDIRCSSSV